MQRLHYRTRRGATLIEFAFVVPVLLLLMLGIMEFGWYGKNQLALANAAREGARTASLGNSMPNIRQRVVNSAKPLTVENNDQAIKLEYSTNGGTSYANFPQDDNLKTPSQNGATAGSLIRVTVSAAHNRLVNLPITPARLSVKVTMIRERS